MSLYNQSLKTFFDTIAKSEWNQQRLKKQYLDELHNTPFLYSSNHLSQLTKQADTEEEYLTILNHLDHHQTEGIDTYDKIRNKIMSELNGQEINE